MRRDSRQVFKLFLALLAVVAQLTLATVVPASTVSMADVTVICQHDADPDAPAKPAHQSPDCLVCFFCSAGSASVAGLTVTPPLLPAPPLVFAARMVVLPPPTAPPFRAVLAARPRGPPIPA
jgi:hypothetical protein